MCLLKYKNLESTMRYLAKARSHEVRAKVDAIWGSKKLKSAAGVPR